MESNRDENCNKRFGVSKFKLLGNSVEFVTKAVSLRHPLLQDYG
ncbi:hypothetical protein C4K04_0357 [Pseudomonas chlororaphis]|uniref:Uncharacterized protein n=1 Tax=Pseudomonas chlororaphis TaxID=587753 RepID=A0A3G7TGU0_9PSED|nr:hypothetical protein C4K04_0357 [Pseudomonas chlororaphis]